jgi:hypothetical protein
VWPKSHCRTVGGRNDRGESALGWHEHETRQSTLREIIMGFGRGALLWLLGVPLPIILLLALFWHN